MNRITSLPALITAICGLVWAVPSHAACEDDCADQTIETFGPALWKVEDEDTTIYLLGTIHVLSEGTQWFSPLIDEALDSSQTLVSELGPTEMWLPDFVRERDAKGTLPTGQTLRRLMNEGQRAVYEKALSDLQVPVNAFDAYEPWVANLNLAILPLLRAGYKVDEGVEQVLEREAAQQLQHGALESAVEQVDALDGFTIEAQMQQLMETVASIPEIVPFIEAIVDEWVEGDAVGVADMLNAPLAADPAFAQRLLYDRNARWAAWIDRRMQQPGTVFIAVGAGHLAGSKSVQEFLSARGYSTTRVQ